MVNYCELLCTIDRVCQQTLSNFGKVDFCWTSVQWAYCTAFEYMTSLMMTTIFVLCSQDKRVLASALYYGGRIIWKILATPVCSTQLICHRLQSIRSRLHPFCFILANVDLALCLVWPVLKSKSRKRISHVYIIAQISLVRAHLSIECSVLESVTLFNIWFRSRVKSLPPL